VNAPGWHLEDVRFAGQVENVLASENACKRLAVFAVADEAESSGWGNIPRDSPHLTASAPKM
jgi:hypothetical protein